MLSERELAGGEKWPKFMSVNPTTPGVCATKAFAQRESHVLLRAHSHLQQGHAAVGPLQPILAQVRTGMSQAV